MKDDIKVSIHCLTYNHEKYVKKTFDGFLAQKTNFKFEVLVHDDASTDGTVDIIRQYVDKYPDIFKPIYQVENQFSKGIKISYEYNFPRIEGKYLAFCEGDDYWCDENKLQKQYDVLEQNPECSMCTHITKKISNSDEKYLGIIPEHPFKRGIISSKDYLRYELINGWASQTSSFFVRSKYIKEYIMEKPRFSQVMIVGDFPTMLYMINKGDVFFIDEIMSCYRIGSEASFHVLRKNNEFLNLNHIYTLLIGIEEYNKYTSNRYEQIIRTYMLIKMEQVKEYQKRLEKQYEPYYIREIYSNRTFRTSLSCFLRRNFKPFYKFLEKIYVKFLFYDKCE